MGYSYEKYLLSVLKDYNRIDLYGDWVEEYSLRERRLLFRKLISEECPSDSWNMITFLSLYNIPYISYTAFCRDLKLKELLK